MDLFDLGEGHPSFEEGVGRIRARSLVVGVPTDLLFPIRLQEEIAALLRSLAVDPRRRREGIGERLLRAVVDLARRRGARELYALTTTIEPLLARRGFTRVDRAGVPAAVRRSPAFETLCPASAPCMRLEGDLAPRAG